MTKRHRRHSTAKKLEIVEAYLKGEALHALSKQHDVCRNLIRVWIEKYERGEYDGEPHRPPLMVWMAPASGIAMCHIGCCEPLSMTGAIHG